MTASPISDLNPLYLAAGVKIKVMSAGVYMYVTSTVYILTSTVYTDFYCIYTDFYCIY